MAKKRRYKGIRYLSKIEFNSVLEIASKTRPHNERNHLILSILGKAGLRVGELLVIKPKDINFQDNNIRVLGKGNKTRNVDIPPELSHLLNLYITNNKIKSSRIIFGRMHRKNKADKPYFKPLDDSTIWRLAMKFSEFNPHAYRHTYAIHLMRRTGNIRYVQKQLGHDSIKSTEIYLQFAEFEEEKSELGTLYE